MCCFKQINIYVDIQLNLVIFFKLKILFYLTKLVADITFLYSINTTSFDFDVFCVSVDRYVNVCYIYQSG